MMIYMIEMSSQLIVDGFVCPHHPGEDREPQLGVHILLCINNNNQPRFFTAYISHVTRHIITLNYI